MSRGVAWRASLLLCSAVLVPFSAHSRQHGHVHGGEALSRRRAVDHTVMFSRPRTFGAVPPGLKFAFATAASGKVFMFGGSSTDGKPISAETIWTLDTTTFGWSIENVSGAVPSPRKLFVGEKMRVGGRLQLIIHGGWNCPWWPCFLPLPLKPTPPSVSSFSDVYTLDLETRPLQWSVLPSVSPSMPAARYGHQSLLRNSSMLIFGGHNGTHYYNDLWRMQLLDALADPSQASGSGVKWTRIEYAAGSSPPAGRIGFGFDQHGNSLYIWNGEIWLDGHDERIQDMWRFDMLTGVWTDLQKPTFPSYLFSTMHIASLNINLIIGGKCNGPVFDKVVYLDLASPATLGAQTPIIVGDKRSLSELVVTNTHQMTDDDMVVTDLAVAEEPESVEPKHLHVKCNHTEEGCKAHL